MILLLMQHQWSRRIHQEGLHHDHGTRQQQKGLASCRLTHPLDQQLTRQGVVVVVFIVVIVVAAASSSPPRRWDGSGAEVRWGSCHGRSGHGTRTGDPSNIDDWYHTTPPPPPSKTINQSTDE
jgi:hypothetical protein